VSVYIGSGKRSSPTYYHSSLEREPIHQNEFSNTLEIYCSKRFDRLAPCFGYKFHARISALPATRSDESEVNLPEMMGAFMF